MNILLTVQKGENKRLFFPESVMGALGALGNVIESESEHGFTGEELREKIRDVDFCITHWGTPKFTKEVLENANRLKMVAHAAGSVAYLITDSVYERGIRVCSANELMAKHVAEGVLAYMLAGLRNISKYDSDMKSGVLWERDIEGCRSLLGERIGLVGLGTVGRYLLELLKPFDVSIKLFDPYINPASLKAYPNIRLCPMEEVLSWGNIVSIHASLTPETFHMIGAEQLKLLRDGCLFVNTSRGAVIDEKALEAQLGGQRFNAVLDVYEQEPLPLDSPLRTLKNVVLMPHMAGASVREQMSLLMIGEIRRYIDNEPLQYEIPYEKYKLMTRE